jgi:hypothetical protein
MRILVAVAAAVLAAAPAAALDSSSPYHFLAQAQPRKPAQQPDVIYVPTPHEVVDDMLRLANVGKGDILYDLGSGDGRIAISASGRPTRTRARPASATSSSSGRRTFSRPTSGRRP